MNCINVVRITGTIAEEIKFLGRICQTVIETKRLSGVSDKVLLDIPNYYIGETAKGDRVTVTGRYISQNQNGHLRLSLYADSICHTDEADQNEVILDGYICKTPVYRKTPLGREITDLHIAVNHAGGTTDYIPCIVWGHDAEYAANLIPGDMVSVIGRIQSREYVKKWESGMAENRTAYEVSIARITHFGGASNAAT